VSTAIGMRGGTRRRLLGAVVVALIWVFPIYWMISSALLPTDLRRTPEPTFSPLSGTLSDFRRVLTEPSFFDASRVSLTVTGSTVVGAIQLAFPATLTISRF
jgi:N,N'-diacetylchitobiose transport system permease protein